MVKKILHQKQIKRNETISREAWLAESRVFAEQISVNHCCQMIDVDRIIELDKQDQEDRFTIWEDE